MVFLSTSSARRTTVEAAHERIRLEISIHVLRKEDDPDKLLRQYIPKISIHVLRKEDDGIAPPAKTAAMHISIHVLRKEDDLLQWSLISDSVSFLSTSSARRTTHLKQQIEPRKGISIHVLRKEDD